MSLEAVRKELKEQHSRLLDEANRVLKALRELGGELQVEGRKKFTMSKEAREKIRQAALKRWASAKKNPQGQKTLRAIKK